ncbi:hypothetical protein [Azotosporobacter soli]|uniref:hypothetical protein n=1 Tax=Azotosporobacter soli TaxID=3055040 RepID=UPI0031FEB653
MRQFTILAISYFLPPVLSAQSIQIGRLLYHSKHRIIAVSGHDDREKEDGGLYADFHEKMGLHITVPYKYRLPGIIHNIATKIFTPYSERPDPYKWWIPKAMHAVQKYIESSDARVDAIVTFGNPMSDHLIGLKFKELFPDVPWVAHFSDPWVDNPFRRNDFLCRKFNRRMEEEVINKAEKVIFTSLETKQLVMQKYLHINADKAVVLAHSYDTNLYESQKYNNSEKAILFRHVGNFYGHRTPEPLFKALAILQRRNAAILENIRVELIGGIPRRMLISPAYQALPKGLVEVKKAVGYQESLQKMQEADVLLVIDAPAEKSVFLPSKLIDYVGAGVDLFGITPQGTSEKLIRDLGGTVIDPFDVEGIAKMIERVIVNSGKEISVNRSEVRKLYDIRNNSCKFDQLFTGLCGD